MAFRDTCVCISSLETDFGLLNQEAQIAEGWQAHLACCAVTVQPAPVYSDGLISGQSDFALLWQAAEESNEAFCQGLALHLQDTSSAAELREVRAYEVGMAEAVSVFARYADVLIARMPDHQDRKRHGEIIEGGLFGAGRPVLALPEQWKPSVLGQNVLFAWDASREASRAIHDALPMLAENAKVCVVTVDARVGPKQHGASPGLDIATHLARHGLKVSVRNEDSLGKPVGERLVEIAKGLGADMIVMGGYRHPKIAQRLVEGPSQFLISKSPLPV